LSASWTSDLLAYLRTRLPPHVFVPLALFLCGAAVVGQAGRVPYERIVLAWALVAQFRLWDDLADRDGDRTEHPDRVLARATSLAPFHLLASALFLVNLGWLLPSPGPTLVLFLALNALFLVWYAGLRRACPFRLVGAHVVLLKYPAFVYVLAAPAGPWPDARLAVTLALVYLTFCVHEGLHDPRLGGTAAPAVLAAEAGALVLLALRLAASPVQVAAAGLGAVPLGLLCWRRLRGPLPAPWAYAVFAVTAAWLLVFTLPPSDLGGLL